MARENDATTTKKNENEQDSSWGTLEELLLACAVNRHGTQNWDSVTMEIQRRSSNLPSLTPHSCKQKYHDLRRRFTNGLDGTDGCDESEMERLVPMVDELRRLRVAELRREVQRRDVSIVSLQLKVKRLEEEREQSLKENGKEEEEADLRKDQKEDKETEREHKEASPEIVAGKSTSGEGSDDRENGSYNESNSTNQKGEIRGTDVDEPQVKAEPVEPAIDITDPVRTESRPVRDWSNKSSLDTVAKKREGHLKVAEAAISVGGIGNSNEFGESVAESKRERKEGTKQNSDVQSSASLSRKKRRRRVVGGVAVGSSSGEEEPEGDEVSPATKRISVKSEPLVRFLGIIRSHKLGSVFERRLRSQETEKYKNLIRQHMDLETVQSRLDKGVYSDCIQRFFRDLLLLFNNAVVFFSKNSPESLAAHELRAIALREMTDEIRKPGFTAIKPDPEYQPELPRVKPNGNKTTPTMVVCRKRSNTKRERAFEEKPKVDEKKSDEDDTFVNVVEKGVMKRRTRERSVLGRRSSRTRNKSGETMKHECGSNVLSSHDDLEAKIEIKDSVVKKKQGAASFLKRMKQNSPPNEVVVGENGNVSNDDSNDGKGGKKRRGRRRDGRMDRVTRKSGGGGREVREQNGQVKRGVGRPPKRRAAASTVEPLPSGGGTGKRKREGGGESKVAVVANSGRPRKRSKR